MALSLVVTRRDYAIEIPSDDFDHLMKSDNYSWNGPVLDELSFNHLRGVHSIEHNGHFGSCVYLKVDTEYDNPETHAGIIEVIEDTIVSIKEARIEVVGEMAEELVDALGTEDWHHIRSGILHTAVATFTEFDAREFHKAFVEERGFTMTDDCMQCVWLNRVIEKFPEVFIT